MPSTKQGFVILLALSLACSNSSSPDPISDIKQSDLSDTSKQPDSQTPTDVTKDTSPSAPCTAFDTCTEIGAIECIAGPKIRRCVSTGTECLAWVEQESCNDDNECTKDTCSPASGCAHEPIVGTCAPKDQCAPTGTCSEGKCIAGASKFFQHDWTDADIRAVDSTSTNGLVIAAITDASPSLRRLSADGTIEWTQTFGGVAGQPTSVASSKTTIALAGSLDGGGGFVALTDSSGAPEVTKLFANGIKGINAITYDDGWLLAGSRNGLPWLGKHAITTGELTIDHNFSQVSDPISVTQITVSNDSIYLAGAMGDRMWLGSYHPGTKTSWARVYSSDPGAQPALAALPSGNIAAASGTYIMVLNPTGELQWQRNWDGTVHHIAPHGNGAIALQAYNDTEALVAAVDLDGEMLWQKTAGKQIAGKPLFATLPDDGMVAAVQGDQPSDIRLVRMNAWGHSTCATAGQCADTTADECNTTKACKRGVCKPKYGCLDENHTGVCESGDSCSVLDYCDSGKCVAGKPELFDYTFESTQNTSPAVSCAAIAELTDGGTALLANHADGSLSLAGIDAGGQLKWEEFYKEKQPNTVEGRDVIRTGSGNLLIVGNKTTPAGTKALRLFASPGANPMELPTLGGTGIVSIASAVELGNSNLLLGGWTNVQGAGYIDGWAILTNSAGYVIWEKTYGTPAEDRIHSVAESSDGALLMAGTTNVTGDDDFWLIKTNANGSYQWQPRFPIPESDLEESLADVAPTDDGGAILAGVVYTDVGDTNVLIIRVAADGKQVWQQKYGGPKEDYGVALKTLPNGEFAVIGTTNSKGSGLNDLWLLRLTSLGQPQYQRTYGSAKNDYGGDILLTADGGLLIGGIRDGERWLVRTDHFGNANCATKGAAPPQ